MAGRRVDIRHRVISLRFSRFARFGSRRLLPLFYGMRRGKGSVWQKSSPGTGGRLFDPAPRGEASVPRTEVRRWQSPAEGGTWSWGRSAD